jgi:hypothetical protein
MYRTLARKNRAWRRASRSRVFDLSVERSAAGPRGEERSMYRTPVRKNRAAGGAANV